MPEMHFRVQWPNGKTEDCYSPSYVIEEHLAVGSSYPVDEFVARVRTALEIASERVRARYGFVCSSALDQLSALESAARELNPAERAGNVRVVAFTKHAPRDAKKAAPERHEVIIVGAGQAGLSVSYCLAERGIEHVVLEAERVAHSWRNERWDTFCLVTPNWQCQLPGHPYSGPDPSGFMRKDEIVRYVESYAESFSLPVREHVRVHSLSQQAGAAGFELETSRGRYSADQVVIAIGCYHSARTPPSAATLPSSIVQLHSSSYRNPASLPDGAVLVVGTGQSGCQIAEDLQFAGRKVHLCVGNAPRCARRYRGRDVVEWLHQMGYYDIPIDQHPNREQVRDKTNHYVTGRDGGRDIDLRLLAREGMSLYGPLRSIDGTRVEFEPGLKLNLDAADAVYRSINRSIDAFIEKSGIEAAPGSDYVPLWEPSLEIEAIDLEPLGIRAIVWCTGFSSNFGWIELPVLDDSGFPQHERGVSPVPGVYFIGLPWLYTWGSGRFSGVGRDARYIAEHVSAIRGSRLEAPSVLNSEACLG